MHKFINAWLFLFSLNANPYFVERVFVFFEFINMLGTTSVSFFLFVSKAVNNF